MTRNGITGLTLDTGALLALDSRGKVHAIQARLNTNRQRGGTLCVPIGAVAQAWRSARQVRLAMLLNDPDLDIAEITRTSARMVGEMCARSGHSDVIDVHVALCARQRGHAVVTSDPDDFARVDASLPLMRI